MRPSRVLLCALAVALVPLAGPAGAASRCGVPDPVDGGSTPQALDITCVNAVIGRTEIVGVLTLAEAPSAGAPHGVGGAEWGFAVNASGTALAFQLRTSLGGTEYQASATVGNTVVPFTYMIDHKFNAIVWRIKRRHAPQLARPKLTLCHFTANTKAYGSTADTASGRGCAKKP